MNFRSDTYLLPLLLVGVAFMAFYKLGTHPVHEWDEAHTAINAFEMLQNGDLLNLYYAGAADELRAKPPLFTWLVATSFQLFGADTFSLRLPSALLSLLAFFFLFQIITLYRSPKFAFFSCLLLFPVKGIIGFHVGRTGDMDMMLLAFLLAGTYHFLRFLEKEENRSVWHATVFFGLAFLAKGPAMAVLFPGLVLYVLGTNRLPTLLRKKHFYYGLGTLSLFPLLWFVLISAFGTQVEQARYAGDNAFERMFLYDLMERFTSSNFENQVETRDPFYFFSTLKSSFYLWNYVFYAVVLAGMGIGSYQYFHRKATFNLTNPANRLLFLSVCIWMSLGIFLSSVTTAKLWYLAPAIPFVAITTYHGIDWLSQKFPLVRLFFYVALLSTMGLRYAAGQLQKQTPRLETVKQQCLLLQEQDQLVFLSELPQQDVLAQLYFCNPQLRFVQKSNFQGLNRSSKTLFFEHKKNMEQRESKDWVVVRADDFYCYLKPRTLLVDIKKASFMRKEAE